MTRAAISIPGNIFDHGRDVVYECAASLAARKNITIKSAEHADISDYVVDALTDEDICALSSLDIRTFIPTLSRVHQALDRQLNSFGAWITVNHFMEISGIAIDVQAQRRDVVLGMAMAIPALGDGQRCFRWPSEPEMTGLVRHQLSSSKSCRTADDLAGIILGPDFIATLTARGTR